MASLAAVTEQRNHMLVVMRLCASTRLLSVNPLGWLSMNSSQTSGARSEPCFGALLRSLTSSGSPRPSEVQEVLFFSLHAARVSQLSMVVASTRPDCWN